MHLLKTVDLRGSVRFDGQGLLGELGLGEPGLQLFHLLRVVVSPPGKLRIRLGKLSLLVREGGPQLGVGCT